MHIFIIGIQGKLRSKGLSSWLDENSDFLNVNYVDPVFPSSRVVDSISSRAFFRYGSSLSPGEVGCSLAHQNAQLMALDQGCKSAWFFEDDAEPENLSIGKLSDLTMALERELRSAGYSLYSRNFPSYFIQRRRYVAGGTTMAQFKSGVFPSFTVAYGLNATALSMASICSDLGGGFPFGKADFPVWGSRVRWSIVEDILVSHSESNSTILDRIAQPFGQGGLAPLRLLKSRIISFIKTARIFGLQAAFLWNFSDLIYRITSSLSLRKAPYKEHWK